MKSTTNTSYERNSGYLIHNNIRTHYEVYSSINKNTNTVPLILLAGGPGLSCKTLSPLYKISNTRIVIGYDQIGSGKSTKSDQLTTLDIDDFIRQFEVVTNELDIKEFHLLGHSWGSILGINIALKYPANVRSLILHSGMANWKECLSRRKNFEKQYFPNDLRELKDKLIEGQNTSRKDLQHFWDKYNKLFYCRVKYPEFLIESLGEKDVKTNQLIWDPLKNPKMAEYDICDRLYEIECPTLIISGKYDGISIGQAELFKTGIKDSIHIEFKNSSHYAHIEEEERFLKQVKSFLNDT